MNLFTISFLALGTSLGGCEFTILNDLDYAKIYVSMNKDLADVVSETTLKNSSSSETSEGKTVTKKNLAITKNKKGKTPFTKWFDIYVPLKSNGQFERRYRVNMHYCKDAAFNTMALSDIKNRKIDMKRFTVINFHDENQANEAHMNCPAHAPAYEHEHDYHRARFEKNMQLTNPGIQQPEILVRPFGDKELLP